MEGKGNKTNGTDILEVEVPIDPEHIDYLIDSGFLLAEDASDSAAIGTAVRAWLKSLAAN